MFQNFQVTSSPETGAERLAALHDLMLVKGIDGFLVPRADVHFGENVAANSERLAWLTGFTGSAGFCAALADKAGVFIDGRYRLQVREQIDLEVFQPVHFPEVQLADWLIENLPDGAKIAYDPWLHSFDEIEKLEGKLGGKNISLVQSENLIDAIWDDRPEAPKGPVVPHDEEFAGESSSDKRLKIANEIKEKDLEAFVLTAPDSIAWLLNIRGSDIERTPVPLCFAVLNADASVDLFIDPDKCDDKVIRHLGNEVKILPEGDFERALSDMNKTTGLDRETAPRALFDLLADPIWSPDPCMLPKACKNEVELAGTRAAHIRDGAAMIEFLCWLDSEAPKGGLDEIAVVKVLESFRRNTNALKDISFDTISGAGPNGAIGHYRVDEDSNRQVNRGEILLVDSGGQYVDGTTDITRTVAVGPTPDGAVRVNTLVLKGMIAITRARWPEGLAGRDLDAFARMALWQSGFDYDHGTGHGVGAYLGVHEGPQRISRASAVPLQAGMILSNEPGYYKEGAYGIRIENLLVVTPADTPDGGDRAMMGFETLTFVPIDKNLIDADLLSADERSWLDQYHAEVFDKLSGLVSGKTLDWLSKACAAI